ncbi:LysR family transcriptional regulator [uncultured Pluralibacter sp.]|uniref:LysR family transcriptional regulator n=1 Tax=uncultured Pluralibacter sp. TaxID=1490864 RepID=UPI00261190B5|nr:LysR family transcriptional regulator [uncultured Pluralibacter sp.]
MFNDFKKLQCFIALAEELHFARAAERLFMTQPPLSRQIRLLEEATGVRLFERNSRLVRLTEAGTFFLQSARQMVAIAEQSVDTARRIQSGHAGRVTLGFTAVSGYYLVPELLARAQQALPGIEIVLKEMVTSEQVDALQSGALALALMRPTIAAQPGLIHHRYHREPMLLALPDSHPLAQQAQILPEHLRQQPMITYAPNEGRYFYEMTLEIMADVSPQPIFVQHISQTHSIMALVSRGFGMALVPASARYLGISGVAFRPLWPDARQAETWIAWREQAGSAAEERLREFIVGELG